MSAEDGLLPVNKAAAERIRLLPEPIRKHIHPDDPYWCFLPEGWNDLVVEMNEKLEAIDPNYIVDQVKEKFGGLRYYLGATEGDFFGLEEIVDEYETKSEKTCDVCGKPGKIKSTAGWLAARCEEHDK